MHSWQQKLAKLNNIEVWKWLQRTASGKWEDKPEDKRVCKPHTWRRVCIRNIHKTLKSKLLSLWFLVRSQRKESNSLDPFPAGPVWKRQDTSAKGFVSLSRRGNDFLLIPTLCLCCSLASTAIIQRTGDKELARMWTSHELHCTL